MTKKAKKAPAKKVAKKKEAKKAPAKSSQVAVVNQTQAIAKPAHRDLMNPVQVMEFGKVLQKYVADNGLAVVIQKSLYPMVDGWKFAGNAFGLTAIPRKPVKISTVGQYITIHKAMVEKKNGKGEKYKTEATVFVGFSDDEFNIAQSKTNFEITKEEVKPYFAYECECDIFRLGNIDGKPVGYGYSTCSNLESLKSSFDEYSVASMSQTRAIGKAYRNLIGHVMKSAGLESTPAEEMDQHQENTERQSAKAQTVTVPKQTCKPVNFTKLCERLIAGEDILELARKTYDFSEEQENELAIILKHKK